MSGSPETRASLLIRLRDRSDAEAWRQFVHVYAPVVYRFGRRKNLQDADAADLTQEVLRAASEGMQRFEYDQKLGTFRSWLLRVAHNKLCDLLSKKQRQAQGTGDTEAHAALDRLPAKEDEDSWNEDYQRRLFHWAAEQIRDGFTESTWQAFWQTAVEGRAGKEVADELQMTVAAVYLAKSRVMKKLKEEIQTLEEHDIV